MRRELTGLLAAACCAAAVAATAPTPDSQLIHSARFWEARDRGDLAQLALKKLVAGRPDSPQALLLLGELDLRTNQFADAAQVESELDRRFGGSGTAREFATEYRLATRDRLQLASVRRLIEIGQTAQARAALARLFPGAPPQESLGIDYYMLLANTPGGLDVAIQGMTALSQRHPDEPRYQLALARLMIRRRQTALTGVKLLEQISLRDDVRPDEADAALASGLLRLGVEGAPDEAVHAYLQRHPGDADVVGLRDAQMRARWERDLLSPGSRSRALPELQQRLESDLSDMSWPDQIRSQAHFWLERSRRAWLNHQEAQAVAELLAALAIFKHDYESEIAVARNLEGLGLTQESGEILATASLLAPQSTWLFESRIRWLIAHGNTTEAIDLLREREPTSKWTAQSRNALLAAALEERAATQAAAGRPDLSLQDLQEALQLTPQNVWMRYRLAEQLRASGAPERGRTLMGEMAPRTPEMRYALALYLSHLEDYEGAYAAIDGIDASQRTQEMTTLHDRMRVALARAKAAHLKSIGDDVGARAALLDAEPVASHNIDRAAELAYSWIGLGSPEHGIGLVKSYIGAAEPTGSAALLTWARVLNSADDTVLSGPVLAQLRVMPGLSDAERADVKQLQRNLDLRQIRDLERHQQFAQAALQLAQLLAEDPENRPLRIARADLDLERGQPRSARDAYASLVAEDPDDLDTRLSYIRALTDAGDIPVAKAQLQAVEARMPVTAGGEELLITLARRQLALGYAARALQTLGPLLAQSRFDVLMLAGHAELAQRHLAAARDYFDRAAQVAAGNDALAARRESQAIEDRLQSSVTVGLVARHQPGSPGLSQLDRVTLPTSWIFAQSDSTRWVARTDVVALDSGHWSGAAQPQPLLGTIQAAPAGTSLRYTGTQQVGWSPDLGFQTDTLAADIGSTPLGFVLPQAVGGIEWTPNWHSADLTLGLARRPVTSSELSYAGLEDPITGTPWGAVVQTGPYAGVGLYRANYSISAALQLAEITGTRVLDNRFVGTRFSGSWKFLSRETVRADAGVTVTTWNYQHDLSNYTFGSGGYYSPQSYVSVSTPIELIGAHAGWTYDLRAAVSYSVSQVGSIAFYPNNATLQSQAARSALPLGYSAPDFPGYHSTGIGLSAYGAAERPLSAGWVIGFLFDLDRTDYYHPTTIGVYLRHAFAPAVTRPLLPPRPLRP